MTITVAGNSAVKFGEQSGSWAGTLCSCFDKFSLFFLWFSCKGIPVPVSYRAVIHHVGIGTHEIPLWLGSDANQAVGDLSPALPAAPNTKIFNGRLKNSNL
jgi:hypothetical protein